MFRRTGRLVAAIAATASVLAVSPAVISPAVAGPDGKDFAWGPEDPYEDAMMPWHGPVEPMKDLSVIKRTDYGYMLISGQQNNRLVVTLTESGRLHFRDRGTKSWKRLAKGCKALRVAPGTGIAATCPVPARFGDTDAMLLEIQVRTGHDHVNTSRLPATFEAAILGDEGNDILRAGPGNDYLTGAQDFDKVFGGGGNDWIRGGDSNDLVHGGAGGDYLVAMEGDDVVYGNAGDDEVYGSEGDDSLGGGPGADKIYGGPGEDKVYGNADDDEVYGSDNNDEVYGNAGHDEVYGNGGHDKVDGNDGNDYLTGADGDDSIDGGPGTDEIYGGPGYDVASMSGTSRAWTCEVIETH